MRRIALIAVSLLTLLLFAGCTGNLFMEWDKPDVPSASEIDGRTVNDQSSADDFLSDAGDWYDGDALSGDGETSDAVVSKLKKIYDDPSLDDKTRQEAAALAGKVAIQSDPNAEQLTKNLIGAFDQLTEGVTDEEDFLRSLIPQSVKDDESSFNAMIDALRLSADAYLALGDSINTNSGEYYISDGELGDSVQYGAISVAVVAALDSLDNGSFDGPDSISNDYSSLYSMVNSTGDDFSDTNPIDQLSDDSGNYAGMSHLLEAAGLSFS